MAKGKKNITVQLKPAKTRAKKKQAVTNQEISAVGKILRSIGQIGGGAAGGLIGASAPGADLGHNLGAMVSRWLGFGDYTVKSNSIVQSASASGSIPNMHKDGQSIIVRHKEFLTEIRGSINFVVRNEFDINPGLPNTFPWLSALAAQYSQYKIRGMVYHYVPTSGNAVSSTNAALGSVMIQTSYRATESAPVNKIELLNEYWSSEAKPSEPFCHPIECDPKENPFNVQYIRSGSLPATENQLMYDLGRTTVAVSGQQANDIALGDLWVTYEIELKKPVITSTNNTNITTFHGVSTSGVAPAAPFGTSGTMNTIFNSFQNSPTFTATTCTFPIGTVGVYQVVCLYAGPTAFTAGLWTISNGTLINVGGTPTYTSAYTVGSGTGVYMCFLRISDPAVACAITANTTTITGATAVRVLITEFNPLASN